MKKFEYLGIYTCSDGRVELTTELNEYGKDGWQVVSILPLETPNPRNLIHYWFVYFMREVVE